MALDTVLRLERLSICECGHAVLDDSIQVGTEYLVDLSSCRGGFRYGCGGCGRWQEDIVVVNASSILRPTAEPAPLPMGLFTGMEVMG